MQQKSKGNMSMAGMNTTKYRRVTVGLLGGGGGGLDCRADGLAGGEVEGLWVVREGGLIGVGL